MRRWLGATLGGLAVLGALLFATAEIQSGGWPELHLHGGTLDGLPVIQALPPDEARLMASLLLLLPCYLWAAWVAASRHQRIERMAERIGRQWRAVAAAGAVVAFVGSWFVAHGITERTPITDDEWAYLFHARAVADGSLAAEVPPGGAHFQNVFMVLDEGRWYSQYPVGHPIVLAAGVLLGDPWVIPPLLAACTVLLLAAVGRELFGGRAAALTAMLAASSPFLLTISGTLLAHTTCLFFLAVFLWAGLRGSDPDCPARWIVLSAVAFGWAVYVRPSSAVLTGVPLFGLLWSRSGRTADPGRRRLLFVGCGAVMVAGQLLLNWHTTGHPLLSGYATYWKPRVGVRSPFGFGAFPWGLMHTPARGLDNLIHNGLRLDAWLLGWPLSLALPAATLALGRRLGAARIWLAAAGGVPFAVYVFYFWPGISDVGPVLYAETLLVWLPLAGGAAALASSRARSAVLGAVIAGLVIAPATFLRPQLRALANTADAARAPLEAATALPTGTRALVFCGDYLRPGRQGSWMAGRPNPWPDLRDRVLYVRSRGLASDLHFWRRMHPEREPYYLTGGDEGVFRLIPARGLASPPGRE